MTITNAPITPLGLLHQQNFRRFWLAQTISMLGDSFYLVALPLIALDLSNGSGVALGTTLMIASVPRAALLLFGGALSDRVSSRRVMILTNWFNLLTIGGLVLLLATGSAQLWHLYLVSLLLGTTDAFFFPASRAILPFIVQPNALEAANSLLQISQRLLLMVGPALAGAIIAVVGVPAGLGIDLITFLIANLFFAFLYERPRQPSAATDAANQSNIFRSIRAGVRYVTQDPLIMGVLALVVAVDFAVGGPLQVGLPLLSDQWFEMGAAGYGLMLSGFGAGSLVGILLAGMLRVKRMGLLFLGLMLAFAVTFGAIAFARSIWWVVLMLALGGVGSGLFNIIGISWLQRRVDEAYIGRVMSLVMLSSVGLSPASNLIAGFISEYSIRILFLGSGALILVATVILSFRSSFRAMTND